MEISTLPSLKFLVLFSPRGSITVYMSTFQFRNYSYNKYSFNIKKENIMWQSFLNKIIILTYTVVYLMLMRNKNISYLFAHGLRLIHFFL